jgi:hypothetical protein
MAEYLAHNVNPPRVSFRPVDADNHYFCFAFGCPEPATTAVYVDEVGPGDTTCDSERCCAEVVAGALEAHAEWIAERAS